MKFSLKKYIHLLTVILYLLAVSCSNVRFLKENQYLYTGAEVKIETQTLSKKEKKELKAVANKLFPKPNSQVLGLRPKLYIHNITKEPKKKKGIRNWLKYKIGEQPILLEDTDKKFNREIIENFAQNKGYFDAKVIDSTVVKNKKAKIIYRLSPGVRYVISDVSFQKDSTQINSEILSLSDKTLLKKDNPI
jgi:outer membrane protein insertion porin family